MPLNLQGFDLGQNISSISHACAPNSLNNKHFSMLETTFQCLKKITTLSWTFKNNNILNALHKQF